MVLWLRGGDLVRTVVVGVDHGVRAPGFEFSLDGRQSFADSPSLSGNVADGLIIVSYQALTLF